MANINMLALISFKRCILKDKSIKIWNSYAYMENNTTEWSVKNFKYTQSCGHNFFLLSHEKGRLNFHLIIQQTFTK